MTTTELARSLADERLAPFLPLIAEAWEDGDPTDLEIAAICLAVLRKPGIDLTCREALESWLDPTRPPAAGDLAVLRAHLAATATGPASG
ncbi:MAG: hypothetical protein R6X29_12790 [Acidimicrobiia bacterium]